MNSQRLTTLTNNTHVYTNIPLTDHACQAASDMCYVEVRRDARLELHPLCTAHVPKQPNPSQERWIADCTLPPAGKTRANLYKFFSPLNFQAANQPLNLESVKSISLSLLLAYSPAAAICVIHAWHHWNLSSVILYRGTIVCTLVKENAQIYIKK